MAVTKERKRQIAFLYLGHLFHEEGMRSDLKTQEIQQTGAIAKATKAIDLSPEEVEDKEVAEILATMELLKSQHLCILIDGQLSDIRDEAAESQSG